MTTKEEPDENDTGFIPLEFALARAGFSSARQQLGGFNTIMKEEGLEMITTLREGTFRKEYFNESG